MNTSNVPSHVNELNQQKLAWLVSQIEVDYPTRESVLGKASYLDLAESSPVQLFDFDKMKLSNSNASWLEVDFHKMTVMFALFMSKNAIIPEAQREFLQEFLAQIILTSSTQHKLYLAFLEGQLVGSAIVNLGDDLLLITDCLLLDSVEDKKATIGILVSQLFANPPPLTSTKNVYIQSLCC
jgi:hypothetical protein